MSFEAAFRKILFAGYDIERVCNSDYLYEVELNDSYKVMTEEEVIKLAETI